MKNNSSGSIFFAVLCVFGIVVMIGMLSASMIPKCIKTGCDRERADGSNYCYLHKSYYKQSTSKKSHTTSGSSSSSKSSSSSSSSSSPSSSSSSSSLPSSSTSSSSSKKSSSKSKKSSVNSYDEGYEAIYEDDDYDWDRYQTDSDYANGVDDAMDDLDW
jgi:hypothetical protein